MGKTNSKHKPTNGTANSAGDNYMLGFLQTSKLPHIDYEYPIPIQVTHDGEKNETGKGLFVIIRNDAFKYEHYLEGQSKPWKEVNNLEEGYKKDTELLRKTFNLKKGDENVKYHENLTAEDPNGENQFEKFIQREVLPYKVKKPSFVFVVLMSHGLANRVFLLADTNHAACCREPPHQCDEIKMQNAEKKKVSCCKVNPGECCAKKPGKLHSQGGSCHERRVKEDLIEKIQENFPGIPKIFLLQICRGGKTDDLSKQKMSGGGVKAPQPKDYIPKSADTLVIYAGAEDQITWVNNTPAKDNPVGSLIVYEFCHAILELEKRLKAISPILTQLQNLSAQPGDGSDIDGDNSDADVMKQAMDFLQGEIAGQHPDPNIRVDVEGAVGGWLDDICRVTAANVARKYLIEEITTKDKVVVDRQALTKAQPEVKSSLHSKLSCIKMMRTQIPSWGKP